MEGNLEDHEDYWQKLFELAKMGRIPKVIYLLKEHSFLTNAKPTEDDDLYEIIRILKNYQEFYSI